MLCKKPSRRLWRQKFRWTSPASEDLKILKTKCQRLWRQKFWWTSLDSTSLKFWRSRQMFVDSDQASLKFKLIRSQRRKYKWPAKSTSDWAFVQGSHFRLCKSTAKSTVRRWVENKFHSISHNGYIIVPDYKRDSKERWRLGRLCTYKRWTARKLQSFLCPKKLYFVYSSACIKALYF